jgi:hypothetical protein
VGRAPGLQLGQLIGDAAFVTAAGALVWLVSGRSGENVIKAEGPTRAAAWRVAVDQARAVGMLPGWRVPQPGMG